jgi:hypothetical protein
MSVNTAVQPAHRTDSHGHRSQNGLTCPNTLIPVFVGPRHLNRAGIHNRTPEDCRTNMLAGGRYTSNTEEIGLEDRSLTHTATIIASLKRRGRRSEVPGPDRPDRSGRLGLPRRCGHPSPFAADHHGQANSQLSHLRVVWHRTGRGPGTRDVRYFCPSSRHPEKGVFRPLLPQSGARHAVISSRELPGQDGQEAP